jgi:hypothetical protein
MWNSQRRRRTQRCGTWSVTSWPIIIQGNCRTINVTLQTESWVHCVVVWGIVTCPLLFVCLFAIVINVIFVRKRTSKHRPWCNVTAGLQSVALGPWLNSHCVQCLVLQLGTSNGAIYVPSLDSDKRRSLFPGTNRCKYWFFMTPSIATKFQYINSL